MKIVYSILNISNDDNYLNKCKSIFVINKKKQVININQTINKKIMSTVTERLQYNL